MRVLAPSGVDHLDRLGPTEGLSTAGLLAAYPHVSCCPLCRSYAQEALVDHRPTNVQAAVLGFHDTAHRSDPLMTASEHFSVDEPDVLT